MKTIILLFFYCWSMVAIQATAQTAIMGALDEEIAGLKAQMKQTKEVKKGGVTFWLGKLKKHKIILLKSGVGKVNAAYSAAILLNNFKIDRLLFTGVAGGLHPEAVPGDIVVGEQVFHHDYIWYLANGRQEVRATSSLIYQQKHPLYFKSDSILLEKAKQATQIFNPAKVSEHMPKIFFGKIATGDMFVNNTAKAKQLYDDFGAYATEMEGAAIAQVAYSQKVPFLIIRSCSDNANSGAALDFMQFLKPAASNAVSLLLEILNLL